MTHPENPEQHPNTTAAFGELFDEAENYQAYQDAAVVDFIQDVPNLQARLQYYLERGFELHHAIRQVHHDTVIQGDSPDWRAAVLDAHNAATEERLTPTSEQTGVVINEDHDLQVTDVSKMTQALRGVDKPDTTTQTGNLYNWSLQVVVDNPLFQVASHAADSNFTQSVVDNAATLAQQIQRLGLSNNLAQGFNGLQQAIASGQLPAWRELYEKGVYTSAEIGQERLVDTEQWDEVLAVLRQLQETDPDGAFTQQAIKDTLGQINQELGKPFDPSKGRPVYAGEVIPDTIPDDMTPDSLHDPYQPLEVTDLAGLTGDTTGVAAPQYASPEDARRIRQEERDEIVGMLRGVRSQLAELPAAASAGDIGAVIMAQQAVLEQTLGHLDDTGTLIDEAATTIALALEGARPETQAIVEALRNALEHLRNSRSSIREGLDKLDQYRP